MGGENLPNLDSDWPGLEENPKEVKFDPDKMLEVARRLEQELEKFTGQDSGSPTDMQTKCANLTSQDFGTWDVGQAMTRVANDTYSALHPAYVKWVQQLQAAIGSIRKSAGNYTGAEDASTQTATNTYQGTGTNPPASQPW